MKSNNLTKRQLEVLRLIAKGLNNKEISIKMDISDHTVKAQVSEILYKLNVTNRLQAAVKALDNKII